MRKTPPESLGSVPLNSGKSSTGKAYGGYIVDGKFVPHSPGELRRELDPDGKITEHRVRKSSYVHERMHAAGKMDPAVYGAAEKFRTDFERAQLSGSYARTDLFRTRSGKGEITDKVAAAKYSISKALEDLGELKDGPSLSQSCIWNVVGLGLTLDDWTGVIRKTGAQMNADAASGVLRASLERLALFYGMVDKGKLSRIRQDQAYSRAVKDVMDFTNVFAASTKPDEKTIIGRFLAAVQKRFGRFA
jgi:hypothetical protein